MLKRIVWATDGSESATRALPYAKSLARQQGGALVVMHSVEVFAGSRAAGLNVYEDEDELKDALAQIVSEARGEGIDASLKIVSGVGIPAAHVIADVAREVAADLIVVGTRGHTALGGLLVGSVTQRLLHVAPCPVLAVPPTRTRGHAGGEREAEAAAARR
jgi:nucleotide-binding universal stress UspA family protein